MPLVEELPVTSSVKPQAGWAYVPDTGPIVAQQPGTRDRKRAAAQRSTQSNTAKREKAVQQRLEALNKENHKDVTVPIPPSNRERDKNRKLTPAVRRILAYQRNFAHYLADEQANNPDGIHYVLPNVQTQSEVMAPPGKKSGRATATRQRSAQQTPEPRRQRRRGETTSIDETKDVKEESDTIMQDVPDEEIKEDQYPAVWDEDPLLKSDKADVPGMPSRRVMELLVSEPPLTYDAARATMYESDGPPPRRFCGICGYWARVKCRKCQDWTCGLMDCWKGHEAVCVMANAM